MEHPKSNSTGGFYRPDGSTCTLALSKKIFGDMTSFGGGVETHFCWVTGHFRDRADDDPLVYGFGVTACLDGLMRIEERESPQSSILTKETYYQIK